MPERTSGVAYDEVAPGTRLKAIKVIVLAMQAGETITLANSITITVIAVYREGVTIKIQVPPHVRVQAQGGAFESLIQIMEHHEIQGH